MGLLPAAPEFVSGGISALHALTAVVSFTWPSLGSTSAARSRMRFCSRTRASCGRPRFRPRGVSRTRCSRRRLPSARRGSGGSRTGQPWPRTRSSSARAPVWPSSRQPASSTCSTCGGRTEPSSTGCARSTRSRSCRSSGVSASGSASARTASSRRSTWTRYPRSRPKQSRSACCFRFVIEITSVRSRRSWGAGCRKRASSLRTRSRRSFASTSGRRRRRSTPISVPSSRAILARWASESRGRASRSRS